MITYDKNYGCWFQMDGCAIHYPLYEMKTYKGNSTSDIIVIFDHDNDRIVNHVYGANTIAIDELDKVVTEYVEEYEAKQREEAKVKAEVSANYKFSKAGVKAFLDDASTDFFAEMDKDWDEQHLEQFDVVVTCGKRQIVVPLCAEQWGCIEECLTEAVEDWEE